MKLYLTIKKQLFTCKDILFKWSLRNMYCIKELCSLFTTDMSKLIAYYGLMTSESSRTETKDKVDQTVHIAY